MDVHFLYDLNFIYPRSDKGFRVDNKKDLCQLREYS